MSFVSANRNWQIIFLKDLNSFVRQLYRHALTEDGLAKENKQLFNLASLPASSICRGTVPSVCLFCLTVSL